VVLAARGTREGEDGTICPVKDPVEAALARERGTRIVRDAALFAAAATALSLIPG
jgi:hypothetical protein